MVLPDELGCKMTDFERKPGDKKNNNSNGSDPMMELTRLFGRNNSPSANQVKSHPSPVSGQQDQQYDAGQEAGLNPYGTNAYSSMAYNQPIENGYAENVDAVYPGQEDAYWSNEDTVYDDGYPQKNYVSEGGSTVDNNYYASDPNAYQSQSDELYEELNYQDNNAPNYQWSEDDQMASSNVQVYGYDASGQLNNQQGQPLYEEDVYASQRQPVVGNEQYYDAPFAQSDDVAVANAINDEFSANETQYWTDISADVTAESQGQPWTPSVDETAKFDNEFGVEANSGVYENNSNPHLASDDAALRSNDSSYDAGPQFFDNFSNGQNNVSRPIDRDVELDFPANENDVFESDYLEQGRPLGAVIAPMRMATQQQSFLGYGQAVAVLPTKNVAKDSTLQASKANKKTGFALGRANPVEANKSAGSVKERSNSAPIGRGINPFTSAKVPPNVNQNATTSSNDGDFEDALNDFNLTIKGDGKKRYKRDPNLKTVRPDQNAVPETQNFDLPTVNYGGVDPLGKVQNPLDHEFSDVLAPGLHDAGLSSYNDVNYGSSENNGLRGTQFADVSLTQSGALPLDDAAGDASKYDWAASDSSVRNADQKAGSGKKILFLLAFLALIFAGVGVYYVFFSGNDAPTKPIVIQRDEGAVRAAPEVDSNASDTNQDQNVYNRVENGVAAQARQSELVDKSEAPVDLDKVDEQAPRANEASLEPNSVEARVLQAAENSLSIHEVPTVTIRDSNSVSGDDINAIIANEQDDVVTPGQSFREHLQTQNDGQQAMPNEDLLASSSGIGSDNAIHSGTEADNMASVLDGNNDQQSVNQDDNTASLSDVQTSGNGDGQGDVHSNDAGLASLSNNNGVSANQLGVSPTTADSVSAANDAATPSVQSSNAASTEQRQSTQGGSNLPAGTFYVQIASQPSREAAQQSLIDIKRQAQVNSAIGNRQVVIVAADIPGRGTYYRVRIAATNQAAANQLCEQLKGLQVTCFVGK